MRRGLVLIALAACGSSSTGADIRITVPSGITNVELFVAPALCAPNDKIASCDTQLGWDNATQKLDGAIYILDIDRLTQADQLDDTHFRIQLKAEDLPRTISRMLVLGTGETDQAALLLKDVDIDRSSGEQWQLALEHIDSIPQVPDRPTTDVNRLHVWNRNDGALARCVAIERWRDGNVTREFLVPEDDPDCDDVADLFECDPYWWHSPPDSVSADDLSCTQLAMVSSLRGTSCLLGGTSCSERLGQQPCTPATPYYCTGSPMCDSTCEADPVRCVSQLTTATYTCTVPSTNDGSPCPVDTGAIPTDVLPMNFSDVVVGSPANCTGEVAFSPVSFSPTFTTPGVLGPITLTPVLGAALGCHINVKWSGLAGATHVHTGLLAIPLSNGTIAVPGFRLTLMPGACGQLAPTCMAGWNAGDDIEDCAYF